MPLQTIGHQTKHLIPMTQNREEKNRFQFNMQFYIYLESHLDYEILHFRQWSTSLEHVN